MELTQHVFNVLPLTEGCLAAQYDQLDTGAAAEAFGIPQLRQTLISAAYGNVLEVARTATYNLARRLVYMTDISCECRMSPSITSDTCC